MVVGRGVGMAGEGTLRVIVTSHAALGCCLHDSALARHDNATMVLEAAPLSVRPGQEAAFEAAFREAQAIIAASPGYRGHELQRCVERPGEYLLIVRWRTLEDHTVRFRQSAAYQDWKRLLHHFYDPFPVVSHYRAVAGVPPDRALLLDAGSSPA